MWSNFGEGARDPNVGAVGREGSTSQGRGPKLSPERCYSFWGGRNWPEETAKKCQKGRRNCLSPNNSSSEKTQQKVNQMEKYSLLTLRVPRHSGK